MRIFNEEEVANSAEVLVLFKQTEIKSLIESLAVAIKTNKRKTTWKKLYDAFYTKAACC